MKDKIWDYTMKRLTGDETDQSRILLDQWLAEDKNHVTQFEEAKAIWELSSLLPPVENDISFTAVKAAITSAPIENLPVEEVSAENVQPARQLSWYAYRVAASLIGIWLGVTFYTQYVKQQANDQVQWISKTAAAGQTNHFLLPDSSEIWLNAGSKIFYSNKFNDSKVRMVKLSGEAYFKVKHDQHHPFVVHSGSLATTVYGTSFSIRAYQNEPAASVAVNSGKVGVTSTGKTNNGAAIMLLPNDKLIYNTHSKTFAKVNISNNDVDAWTTGELIFDETPLPEVFATLSRKFNVTINADPAKYKSCTLSARFRAQSLQAILKTLKLSMNINSTPINGIIYIKGGTVCNKN